MLQISPLRIKIALFLDDVLGFLTVKQGQKHDTQQ